MNLFDINGVTQDRYVQLLAEGRVTQNEHPSGKLLILNYTDSHVATRDWCPTSKTCRGLITDMNYNIVSRSFDKCFNVFQDDLIPEIPTNQDYQLSRKMDGCLGVGYMLDGKFRLSSRGSFTSEAANIANRILDDKYPRIFDNNIPDHLTYIFEIIHPDIRILVDYGNTEDIVLIGVRDKETGEYIELPSDFPTPVTEFSWYRHDEHPFHKMSEKILSNGTSEEEGYVVRFENGTIVKLKYREYLEVSKYMDTFSGRRIWKYVSNLHDENDTAYLDRGRYEASKANIPNYWRDVIEDREDDLRSKFRDTLDALYLDDYRRTYASSYVEFQQLDRSDLVEAFQSRYPKRWRHMLYLWDGKTDVVEEKVWKGLKSYLTLGKEFWKEEK